MNLIWVLISCNTTEEANKIGEQVLQKRLVGCFDVLSREVAKYFWPPKSGKLEANTGSLLVLTTFEEKYPSIVALVKELHSDETPFVGFIKIDGVNADYLKWLEGEING